MFVFIRNGPQTSLAAFVHQPENATRMNLFLNAIFLTSIQASFSGFSL